MKDHRTHLDPMLTSSLTRRELLARGGRLGAGVSAAAFLAACGVGGRSDPPGAASPEPAELPPLAKQLAIAQWPLYIDKKVVRRFERSTGIEVTYKEVINDNQQFYAALQPSLEAGEVPEWDLIALSDWVVTKMNHAGYLEALDHSLLSNVTANIGDAFADPPYDPGNAHSVPWQGGITGIAYNSKLVDGDITRFEDLWDPSLKGHVGMLTEMVDSMNLTILMQGIDPLEATLEDARRAQQKLLEQRDAGLVRGYYGNDYLDGLSRGDLWATMAWSGDIFWLSQDQPEIRFAIPEEGGLLWVTPLEIPKGAQHPRDAHSFLDYVYDPEVAADITAWVGFISPVPEAKDVLLDRAAASKKEDAAYYESLANNDLIFLSPEVESEVHSYKVLSPEEEQQWADLFGEVVTG